MDIVNKKTRTKAAKEHTIRTKTGGTVSVKLNRGRAIKAMCTECLGWNDDPKGCTSPLCPLFPFRGKILLAYK